MIPVIWRNRSCLTIIFIVFFFIIVSIGILRVYIEGVTVIILNIVIIEIADNGIQIVSQLLINLIWL